MTIHDLPEKWRERAHGDLGLLACADELEAHLKSTELCRISAGKEVHFDVVVPDAIFKATIKRTSYCTLSTKSGETRRATLVFA